MMNYHFIFPLRVVSWQNDSRCFRLNSLITEINCIHRVYNKNNQNISSKMRLNRDSEFNERSQYESD